MLVASWTGLVVVVVMRGCTHRGVDGQLTEKQQKALKNLEVASASGQQLSAKQAKQLKFLSASPAHLRDLLAATDPAHAAAAEPPVDSLKDATRHEGGQPSASKAGLSREERRELTKRKLEAQAAAAVDEQQPAAKATPGGEGGQGPTPPSAAAAAPSASKAGLSREERRELTKRKLEAQAAAAVDEQQPAAKAKRTDNVDNRPSPPASAIKAPATSMRPTELKSDTDAKDTNANVPATTALVNGKSKSAPCSDVGRWGEDGQWVYPTDVSIVCSLCNSPFVFTGAEQAWYAQRSMYAPVRCAPCLAARKEAKEAKQRSGKSGDGRCFNCGEQGGHKSADCPFPRRVTEEGGRKACYHCASLEHLSRNCPKAVGGAKAHASGCFICSSLDHLSRACPQKPPVVCLNCGAEGHVQKACEEPQRTEGVCFAFQKGRCHKKNCVFTH